jgi:two-component system LytT family response regulator
VTIRVLVVDDEPLARARLCRLLAAHPDVTVIGEAATGDEALARTLALRPDVLFLDIVMPGPSGTEVAARLVSWLSERVRPAIVFTTAHAEHAVAAYALEGLDYLLKPVERDRLAEALRRVRRSLWSAGTPEPAQPSPPPDVFLTGHHGTALSAVPIGAIRAVEVEDGTAWATTEGGARTRLGEGLAEIEATLPSPPFLRVSRSALVNTERILKLHPKDSGTWEAELEGGIRVAVSRRRAPRLRTLLGLG